VEDRAEGRVKKLGHWHEGRKDGREGGRGGREGGRGGGREEGRAYLVGVLQLVVEDGAEWRIKELGHWHKGREGGGKEGGREGGRGRGREEGRTLSEYCSLS